MPLVERLEVTEGSGHQLHVDLSAWAPRPVHFQVTVDGAGRSLRLYASHARVRLLTPDGQPLPHTDLLCLDPDATTSSTWEHVGEASPTDSTGRSAIRGRPGPVQLRVIRGEFVDWAAWNAWRDAHDAPTADRFVQVDGVTLAPGASLEIELRLPAEWAELPH